ncbi:MAG TPA: zf-HC2 domain-containing protein [Gemmatimonadales bacterium]|nr:zf-HC2 domain-containing protein [Gemmatimonadales bacterium]
MSDAPHSLDCREAIERLYEYLDQELTPDVRQEVERHLRMCGKCHQHFEFEQAFLRFLEARARGRGAGPEVKRRVLEQLFGTEDR